MKSLRGVGGRLSEVLLKLGEEFSFMKGNMGVLVASWMLMHFASSIPEAFYGQYVRELGGNAYDLGLIGMASLLALASVQLPGGHLADKRGRRELIVLMTFGVASSYLFYALALEWRWVLVGAVIQNFCLIYQSALMAIEADSLPPERRGVGYSSAMLLVMLASSPGPLLGGVLCARYGLLPAMRAAYLFVFLAYTMGALLRFRLKETLELKATPSLKGLLTSYPRAIRESVTVWKDLPSSALWLLVSMLAIDLSIAPLYPYWLLYALDVLHVSEVEWGSLSFMQRFAMMLIALPLGKLIDVAGRRRPLLVGVALMAPSTLFFLEGATFKPSRPILGVYHPLLLASFLLASASTPLINVSYSSLMADLVPKEKRGRVIGCAQFTGYICMALGSLIEGSLYERVSRSAPFYLSIIVGTIASLVIIFLKVRESGKRER